MSESIDPHLIAGERLAKDAEIRGLKAEVASLQRSLEIAANAAGKAQRERDEARAALAKITPNHET